MPPSSNPDCVHAFAQLGRLTGENWAPLGGGFLLLADNRPWLVTARTVLEAAGDQELVAWVGSSGTAVAITNAMAKSGLEWVVHPDANLAVCPFPLDPAWGVKAFSPEGCMPADKLVPPQTVCSLGSAYGLNLGDRPPVLLLDGILSSIELERGRLFTTAPLLPFNDGAPLLVITAPPSMGGVALLAGVMAQSLPVRPPVEGMAPPHLVPTQLHLSLAHPIGVVFDLLRSESALAQLAKIQEAQAQD